MLIHAIWLLEEEKKFLKKHTSNWPDFEGNEYAYMMMAVGATAQTAAISISTYAGIQKAYSITSDYAMKTGQIKGFRISSPGFKAVPYGFSTRRLLAAKVATRFIPYAGWALFAYDMWSVGKWIGEKTSPV